jgi:HK97 family phage prohead protease
MAKFYGSTILEFKLDDTEGSRRISGYGAKFNNVDSQNDIIVPGAFTESLTKRKIKMFRDHNSAQIAGVWEIQREDQNGLYVEGVLANTPIGDETYELAKMGALDGMSIGYRVRDFKRDNKTGVRTILKTDVYEVSLVAIPANEEARVTNVKNNDALYTERELENILRDAGYSREASKFIVAHGFKAFVNQREAGSQEVNPYSAAMLAAEKFQQLFK